jgi:hypothetical protein
MDLSKKSQKKYEAIMSQIKGRVCHSILRAWQRYEIEIDEHDYFNLVNQIMTLEAEFVKEIGHGKSLWKVRHKDRIMYAIYQEVHHSICTFLSREMI